MGNEEIRASSRDALRPGDLVMWVEDDPDIEPSPLLVHEDSHSLLFQFARVPWHEMTFEGGARGLDVERAEQALNAGGDLSMFGLPGLIYRAEVRGPGQGGSRAR